MAPERALEQVQVLEPGRALEQVRALEPGREEDGESSSRRQPVCRRQWQVRSSRRPRVWTTRF